MVSRNIRAPLKTSSKTSHSHILLLNPEAAEKLYGNVRKHGKHRVGQENVSGCIIRKEYRSRQARYRSQGAFFNEHSRARLACLASRTVGSHVSHAAYVDADRRQDSLGPHPAGKPLVEYRALCEYARFDDFTDSVSWGRV